MTTMNSFVIRVSSLQRLAIAWSDYGAPATLELSTNVFERPSLKGCRALAAPEALWVLAGGDTTLRAADNNPIQIGRESGVVSESDGVASGPQWNRYGCACRNRETGATQRQLQSRAPINADRE